MLEPIILFESDTCLAVNKPAGLIVHGDGKTKESTLAEWILKLYPDLKNIGEPWTSENGEVIPRPGIVHRLDRETSGVILIAKTQEAFDSLKEQFQNHTIEKTYHAFVYGEMKNKKGVIDRPIGRSTKDFRMWSAQRGARGVMREAVTEYEVVLCKEGYSFIHAFPKTGRTHQIRVHFKAINYPLVHDSLYAPQVENTLGFERLALHSYKVIFTSVEGESVEVVAPYPEDFARALSRLQL